MDNIWNLKNDLDDLYLKNDFKVDYIPGEIIVKFKNEVKKENKLFSENQFTTGYANIDTINQNFNLLNVEKLTKIESSPALDDVYKLSFPEDIDITTIIENYEKEKTVEYAEPNYIFNLLNTPDNPYYSLQWALNQPSDCDIDAPEAWDIETGDENIIIAIIDTGVDYNHPNLADNIWSNTAETINSVDDDGNGYIDDIRGWDFFNKNNDPDDDYGHGTHCSGVASAVTNNSVRSAGIFMEFMRLRLDIEAYI